MRLARDATDLRQRTGINGFDLSPLELEWQMRVLDERTRATARLDGLVTETAIGSAFATKDKYDWSSM